jgi:hypothetical protein
MGSYGRVLSCQVISATAPRGPGVGSAYPLVEALG